jgi:hypothetical protein
VRVNQLNTFIYRGVGISKVLAIPLYGSMISNVYKAIFHCNSFDKQPVASSICVIYSHQRSGRNDYFQIAANLVESIKVLSPAFVVMQARMSIVDKIRLLVHFIKSMPVFFKLQGSLLYKLYLVLLIARVRVNIDYAMKFLEQSNIDIVVTFCDAYDLDNIITQCANNLNKTTITLQHGQYCIDKRDVPENMALSNLVSDYLCAWGQATCDEFAKVNNDATVLVSLGSLRSETHNQKHYTVDAITQSKNSNIICVMLNADNCLTSNIEMLQATIEFCALNNYQYCVRFHPKNYQPNYAEFVNNKFFIEYQDVEVTAIAFSIIFTSGVMVELLSQGELFFLYENSTTPNLFQQNLLSFTSPKQLELLVDRLYRDNITSAKELNLLKKYFINTNDVNKNYLTFFNNLLTSKEGNVL